MFPKECGTSALYFKKNSMQLKHFLERTFEGDLKKTIIILSDSKPGVDVDGDKLLTGKETVTQLNTSGGSKSFGLIWI